MRILTFLCAVGALFAIPAVTDTLDQGYCYCAANYWIDPGADKQWWGNPVPRFSLFMIYVHYYSEVHQRHYTNFWKQQDADGAWEDDRNAWRAGSRTWHSKYILKKFDDGVVLGNSRWRYRFNTGIERMLPGWNKKGREIGAPNMLRETITDCTDWCRIGWPHLKDVTSICNETAPGSPWLRQALDDEWEDWYPLDKPRANPEHYKECHIYHYKDLIDTG